MKNCFPSIMIASTQWLLSVITLCLTFASYASSPLQGFTTICTVDENCAVEESTLVAFGSGQKYTYKTLSGNFLCAASTFEQSTHKLAANPTCLTLNQDASPSGTSTSIKKNSFTTLTSGQYAIISAYTGKALTVAESDLDDGALIVQQSFDQQVNQLWQVKSLENGYYSITALHSQKALESQDWNNTDGVNLQQFSWINSTNQHWAIQSTGNNTFQISSRLNGHVIDLIEMNNKENGEVCLWTNWGGNNQNWKFIPINTKID